MSDKPPLTQEALLKKISDTLTWGVIFLFIIMLNTCSFGDDVRDAIRDARNDATPAAASKDAS